MKTLFKILLLLFIIFLSAIISIFLFLNRPAGNIKQNSIEFEIRKGDTSYSVSQRLFLHNYIRSKKLFIIIVRTLGMDKKLKKGWVKLESGSTTVKIINSIYNMYHKSRLVHCDMSAYNILIYKNNPYLIDLGQALLLDHPKSHEYLKRDIHNIVKYFIKYDIKFDENKIYNKIVL